MRNRLSSMAHRFSLANEKNTMGSSLHGVASIVESYFRCSLLSSLEAGLAGCFRQILQSDRGGAGGQKLIDAETGSNLLA